MELASASKRFSLEFSVHSSDCLCANQRGPLIHPIWSVFMHFPKNKPLPWTGTMDGRREDGGGLMGIKNLIQFTQKLAKSLPLTHTFCYGLPWALGHKPVHTGDFCSVLRCDSFIPRVISNDQ